MQNRKVAIIDDNQDSLRELEEILRMAGYTPVLVDDILGAVDTAIENKPDVILMELKMPHKNGFALPMRSIGFLKGRKFQSSRCQIFLKMNLNGLWIFVA